MNDYLRLAALQGCQPGDYAAFRRYLPLQALSLLRQQNQIARLQSALKIRVPASAVGPECHNVLPQLVPGSLRIESETVGSKELALWNELDTKLSAYGKECIVNNAVTLTRVKLKAESLIRFDALSRLPSVDRRHHRRLTDWLTDPEGGNDAFHGADGEFWNEEHIRDLAALGNDPPSSRDALKRAIRYCLTEVYHPLSHHYRKRLSVTEPLTESKYPTAAWEYSAAHVAWVENIVNAVGASLSISLSALTLYFVPTTIARLGAIVAFTSSFSVLLVLMTGATRTECFVATAAYAAVLVVFVGSDASGHST